MNSTPMILDDGVREKIRTLVALAESRPVEMTGLSERLQVPDEKAKHRAQMTEQSIEIPLAFLVTFSIERGHPCGVCRHLSMSVQREGRLPNQIAVWLVAQEFGFWGALEQCLVWLEDLTGHGQAVNLVQPVEEKLKFEKLKAEMETVLPDEFAE